MKDLSEELNDLYSEMYRVAFLLQEAGYLEKFEEMQGAALLCKEWADCIGEKK